MPFHPKPPKVHLAAGEAISCRRGWVQWENSSRSDATQRPDLRKCGNASTQKINKHTVRRGEKRRDHTHANTTGRSTGDDWP